MKPAVPGLGSVENTGVTVSTSAGAAATFSREPRQADRRAASGQARCARAQTRLLLVLVLAGALPRAGTREEQALPLVEACMACIVCVALSTAHSLTGEGRRRGLRASRRALSLGER